MEKNTLGMLGLGSRTTVFYLSELNRLFHEVKGGYSTCPCTILNTNFHDINSLLPTPSPQLDKLVAEELEKLDRLGVTRIIVPNITLHETLDRLGKPELFIHPIELAAKVIMQKKYPKIVLFGSLATMQAGYIRSIFTKNGIETILPSQADMEFIDSFRKSVYAETESLEQVELFKSIVAKYSLNHPVVLACTELSIHKMEHNERIIDMAQLQLKAAVHFVG